MAEIKLKPLEFYQEKLNELRKRNPYAKNWKLEIVRYSNKHPETNGHPWGWYEIFPLNITIGYWGSDCNDLKGFDIKAWNRRAEVMDDRD